MRWRRPRSAGAGPGAEGPGPGELLREARLLRLRARRQVSGEFAGAWASAFRGAGMDFEESRPYHPGDDVRHMDWNATARLREPFVKRFREERGVLLLLLLDVSASMALGSAGPTKALAAARVAALLAAAAARTRDRVGLVTFDERVRAALPPARSEAHLFRVLRTAVAEAHRPSGGTALAPALRAARRLARRHAVVWILSDFREGGPDGGPAWLGELPGLARQHDVVGAVVSDAAECELPPAGPARFEEAERPGRALHADTGSPRLRARFAAAAAARRRALDRALRGAGADPLFLRTSDPPLPALARFLGERRHRVRGDAP